MKPHNLPERLIWNYIIWNYLIYFLGAQFILAPLMAWFLLGYLVIKWWKQNEDTPEIEQIHISVTSWIWVISTLLIGATHFIGSMDFNVDIYIIARDFVNGWIKMWALFAIFPLIGHLNIRPQLIFRAICIFCTQSIFLVILFWIFAFARGGKEFSYISPFFKFGGQLNYYTVVVGNSLDISEWRLYMNAPWAPALGMMASIFLFLVIQESDKRWRLFGLVGAIAMIVSTSSRTAIIGTPLIFGFVHSILAIFNPWSLFSWSGICFLIGLSIEQVTQFIQDSIAGIKQYRNGSTKAREELNQLAFDAWKDEAPFWGHGSYFEKSSGLSGSRSFVSDSTLNGVLYSNGLIGAFAISTLFIWTFIDLLLKVHRHSYAKVGLQIMCVLFIFLGTENIQATAYIYWPGLVVLGAAFKNIQVLEPQHEAKVPTLSR